MPKSIELCMSENRKLQKILSMFVEKALKIRTRVISLNPYDNKKLKFMR